MAKTSRAETLAYLKSPTRKFALAALLVCVAAYGMLTNPQPYALAIFIVLLMSLAVVAALACGPRWAVYALLAVALVIRVYAFVIIISSGPQDSQSTRDDAVEVTARALLQGKNAWNVDLGVGVTTGPTSILVALPFVIVFNAINWLSFGFWVLFFTVLLWGDIHYGNDTWPTLVMMFMLGLFALEHTMYWSLEELYYPILYLALAYWLATHRHWWGVGILSAACVLSRLNYVFMLVGFGYWYLLEFKFNWRSLLKIGLGFVLGGVVILLPFVIIGGKDIVVHNPWRYAVDFSGAAWPDTNFVFHSLNQLNSQIGSAAMRWVKLGVTLITMFAVAWGLRRGNIHHPFWHITAGALIAHTFVWLPAQWPNDYAIIFVLPAFVAMALTGAPTAAAAEG